MTRAKAATAAWQRSQAQPSVTSGKQGQRAIARWPQPSESPGRVYTRPGDSAPTRGRGASRRRLVPLLALAAIGALAALSISSSLALLSSTAQPSTASFSTGAFSLGSSSASSCTLVQGGPDTCTYTITYEGQFSAWLGIGTRLGAGVSSVELSDSQGQEFQFAAAAGGYQLVNPGGTGDQPQPLVGRFETTFSVVSFSLDPGASSGTVTISALAVGANSNPLVNGEPSW